MWLIFKNQISAIRVLPAAGIIKRGSGVPLGTVSPEDIYIHPSYEEFYLLNDIALIKTSRINFSSKLEVSKEF